MGFLLLIVIVAAILYYTKVLELFAKGKHLSSRKLLNISAKKVV